jgi:hypothetical protein
MGMPSGLARSRSAPTERKLATALYAAALFTNFRLEIELTGMDASSWFERTNAL